MTRTISARYVSEHDVIEVYGSQVTVMHVRPRDDSDGMVTIMGFLTADGANTGYTVNLYVSPAERLPLIRAHYDA